jgi:hypothetical protein
MASVHSATLLLAASLLSATPVPWSEELECGTEEGGASRLLALHRYWEQAGALRTSSEAPDPLEGQDRDQDDVAVLYDRADMVALKNPFDLGNAALRFAPKAGGGYEAVRLSLPKEPAGDPLSIPSGGALSVALPFAFPFFGRRFDRTFVHADGNLTFGDPDAAAGPPGLASFLAGPPRIACFFASLDPARGGVVSARLLEGRAVFLWDGIPGAGQINRNSFQLTLHPNGAIDMVFGEMQTHEAVVGVSPGQSLDVTAADFSSGMTEGGPSALAERFSETEKVDLVSVSRRFLATHPDHFDQLVVYTTRPLNPQPGTLAFEINVKNEVQGIGLEVVDHAREYGSGGALASLVYMDSVDQYLDVDGFEILGHEVGHRWLAHAVFRDASGAESRALLGRGGVHWSFFMNTDASVMEGNTIEDLGGGRFETVDFARRYSALDQYLMGFRAPSEVPPFFYVEAPDDFRPNRGYKFSSPPEAGVTFTGRRRDVPVADLVAALGSRLPAESQAPRRMRQAFLLVADQTAPALPPRREAVARIRARFEQWYREATGGRATVDSTLP